MSRRLPAVGLVLLTVATPARGQEMLKYHGSEVFRFALHLKNLKPVEAFHELEGDPADSLVVVLGRTDELHRFIKSSALLDFVSNGGAVLTATDTSNLRP